MVTRPAASPPMEMSKKTCERGASGVSMHRAHAQGQCQYTLLVTLGPFFAAEAVARQATISLSVDIRRTRGKVGAGCKARNVLLHPRTFILGHNERTTVHFVTQALRKNNPCTLKRCT